MQLDRGKLSKVWPKHQTLYSNFMVMIVVVYKILALEFF